MWWMMGNNFPGWWMGVGLLWSLIFWGAIIFLIVWGIRTLAGRREERPPDPLTLLKMRYARGEITREQYEQMRQDLLK
ncbi:hypothetical protein HRbin23_00270 [bacterium HR23]|nr:hypothetical protein HRbin23_00270 [bacterium HR23]